MYCRYKSIHRKRTVKEISRAKSAHKTFGQAQVSLKPPKEFLKKGEGPIVVRPKSKHVHYRPPNYIRQLPEWKPLKLKRCRSQSSLPELPRDPVVALGQLDYQKKNIEDVGKYKDLRVQPPKLVDTRYGDKQELKPSGLVPVFIYKKVTAAIVYIKSISFIYNFSHKKFLQVR